MSDESTGVVERANDEDDDRQIVVIPPPTQFDPTPMKGPETPWEEYKLLQDKIDRIGQFLFTIKGWCVTLVSGLVAANFVAKAPWWIGFGVLFILLIFWMLESYQTNVRTALEKRATQIEIDLKRAGAAHRPQITVVIGHHFHAMRGMRRLIRHANKFFYIIIIILVLSLMIMKYTLSLSEIVTL